MVIRNLKNLLISIADWESIIELGTGNGNINFKVFIIKICFKFKF